MLREFPFRQIPLLLLLTGWVLWAGADESIESMLNEAEALNITAPLTEGWSVIRQLLTRIDQATPRQQGRIELLATRNLALQGKTEEAMAMARSLAAREDYSDLQLSGLRILANLAMNSGQFDVAFVNLDRALKLLEEIDVPSEAVTVYGLASQFYSDAGDATRAIEFGLRALENARRAGVDRLECLALFRLSIAYQEADRLDDANDAAERALPFCDSSGDPVALGVIRLQIGDLRIEAGQLQSADELLNQALASLADSYRVGEAGTRVIMAKLALARGQPAEAMKHIQAVLPEARQQNWGEVLEPAYAHAANAAEQLGNLREALEYRRLHLSALEQNLERAGSLRLAMAQVRFDVTLQEQELALLREQKRVYELERQARQQRQRLQELFVIAGAIALILLSFQLVRALRERRHFHRLSETDGLTGLYNHTRFFGRAEVLMREAKRTRRSFVLILADIDNFKDVNDRYGHQIGDEVLKNTARVLAEQFDDGTVVGRIGGEEFAICMVNYSQAHAVSRVDALRKRLATYTRRENDPKISMSFGVGVMRPDESLLTLRTRVDQALYRAKHEGRDRVVVADNWDPTSGGSLADAPI